MSVPVDCLTSGLWKCPSAQLLVFVRFGYTCVIFTLADECVPLNLVPFLAFSFYVDILAHSAGAKWKGDGEQSDKVNAAFS